MSDALRAATVAILGWTNVGKSTLLNRLVGDKLAAVADAAQTTRHRITGVLNLPERGQLVFVDTPGLHRPRSRLNQAMVRGVHRTLSGVDLALLVIDASRGLGEGDRGGADLLARAGIPRIAVLNKIDRLGSRTKLLPMLEALISEWGMDEAVPVSALDGEGCDRLVEVVLSLAPCGPPLVPEDYLTDQTERALAAEWIREKLLRVTRQELPHAMAVMVDSWQDSGEDAPIEIHATILVDRVSQKQIVIGRGGALLGQIGREARLELEEFLGRRVDLRLWVKVRADWRNDERILRQLGL